MPRSVATFREVLVLAFTMSCASADSPAEGPASDVGKRESALEADAPEIACSPDVDPPPLTLGIDELEAGALDRSRDESVAITIASSAREDLVVAISAYTLSKYGEVETAVTEISVGAGETDVVELPVSALGLPDGPLENSANLILTAKPRAASGEAHVASRLPLYYHPRNGGFVFYNEATRVAEFDSGALTEDARALRDVAENEDAPQQVVVVHTGEWLMQPGARQAEEEQP